MSAAAVVADVAMSNVVDLLVDELTIGDDFRLDDDGEQLAELAASIVEHGVLQPLLVREVATGWEVVAGRRRLAAARAAGLTTVPCLLRSLSDDQAIDAALAENMHRRNLSPIEEGLAYAHLRAKGLTQANIAHRVGRSQKHVSRLLQVLELPEHMRKAIHEGRMSYTTAIRDRRPTGKRQGGADPAGSKGMNSDSVQLISYWRRRHDRLLAGVHAVRRQRFAELDEARAMLDRLIKVDATPFEEGPT